MIQRNKAAAMSQELQFKPSITKVMILCMLLPSGFQVCTLSFAEVPNQGNIKTSEGTSFAAAPGNLLTVETSTMPVQHTREESECPTKMEKSEGIVV